MAIKLRMAVLARVPLFAGLAKRHMQAVARVCVSRRWAAGCCVVAEESTDQIRYIIVEGTVDVRRNGRTIAQLGPGELSGEIALLDPGPRSATVTTATEMIAVELSRQSPGGRRGRSSHLVANVGSSGETPPGDNREGRVLGGL